MNVQVLRERTEGIVELIGVKLIGYPENTLDAPFELWTAYSGPNSIESATFTSMLKKKIKKRKVAYYWLGI